MIMCKKHGSLSTTMHCLFLAIIALLISCSNQEETDDISFLWGRKYYPNDNAYSETRFELGRKLFYDTRLSKDSTISCGSCHKQEYAFADNKPTTPGVFTRPGNRNVPSLSNIGFHPYYLREGSLASLEMQVLVPIQEHNEFAENMVNLIPKFEGDTRIQDLSYAAYGRKFDAYVLTRALANFQRALDTHNSDFDKKLDKNSAAYKGYQLFKKIGCDKCHSGINFTNYKILNNGLYETYKDPGLQRVTYLDEDNGKFKVASLRNLLFTAPYMHDGSMATLEDVIQHYSTGGKNHINKSKDMPLPFKLSDLEKKQLIAFLHSLSDINFINDQRFSEPK